MKRWRPDQSTEARGGGEGVIGSGGIMRALHRYRDAHEAAKIHARHQPGVGSVVQAPLPLASRLLLWGLIGFLAVALVWASLGRIEVVAFAEGTTIVNSRVQPVQSSGHGIVTSVLVREGDRVKAGQPLIHMQHGSARARVESLRERLWRSRAGLERVSRLMAHGGDIVPDYRPPAELPEAAVEAERALMHGQWRSHRAEIDEFVQQRSNRLSEKETVRAHVDSIDLMLPYLRNRVDRMERLSGRDLASLADLDEARRELAGMEMDRRLRVRRLAELEGEIALVDRRMDRAESRFLTELAEERTELDDRLVRLREQLADAEEELERRTLRAPRDGVIQDVAVHSAGTVVEPAQVLMRIVPEGQPLEVEARILNQDIGFAEPGQSVKVKFDAFEFTRYGAVVGRIRDIAPSSTEDEEFGDVYRTLVSLDRDWIWANGKKMSLRPGMTATVDIEIGERRVIEYFLGPMLRYRDVALRER